MNTRVPEEVFEIGILDRDYHDRLLTGLDKWTEIAGIPEEFVWSKLSRYCKDEDLAWVRELREDKSHGMIYTGDSNVEMKMMAITGACLRNYIDARFMTVQQVLSRLMDDDMPDASVVLIPNFCMEGVAGSDGSGSVLPWQSAKLLGWLYSRLAKGLKTVLYVSSMKTLEKHYGEAMAKHLKNHYVIVQ